MAVPRTCRVSLLVAFLAYTAARSATRPPPARRRARTKFSSDLLQHIFAPPPDGGPTSTLSYANVANSTTASDELIGAPVATIVVAVTNDTGLCGCSGCDDTALDAPADAVGAYTCRDRIAWLISQGNSTRDACAKVAGEYPSTCGVCACDTTSNGTSDASISPDSEPKAGPAGAVGISKGAGPQASPCIEASPSKAIKGKKGKGDKTGLGPAKFPLGPSKGNIWNKDGCSDVVNPGVPDNDLSNERICGCDSCTWAVLNSPTGSDGLYTCQNRIRWLISQGSLEADACAKIASDYVDACGDCACLETSVVNQTNTTINLPSNETLLPPIDSGDSSNNTQSGEENANSTYCGCEACDQIVLDMPTGSDGAYTCRDRIEWVIAQGSYKVDACNFVADEYPTECGACSCGASGFSNGAAAGGNETNNGAEGDTTTYCGCEECDLTVLTALTDGVNTCRDRISWAISQGTTEADACSIVADQFPAACGVCDCGHMTKKNQTNTIDARNSTYCGCEACDLDVLDNLAGDDGKTTCRDRIEWLIVQGSFETEACSIVAEDFPSSCGPCACHANTTDAPHEIPFNSTSGCGCEECTSFVLDTSTGSDGIYTCRDRIEWLVSQGASELDACATVSSQYDSECGVCACGNVIGGNFAAPALPTAAPKVFTPSPTLPPQSPPLSTPSPTLPPQSLLVNTPSPTLPPQSLLVSTRSPTLPPQSALVSTPSPTLPPQSALVSTPSPTLPPQSPLVSTPSPTLPPQSSPLPNSFVSTPTASKVSGNYIGTSKGKAAAGTTVGLSKSKGKAGGSEGQLTESKVSKGFGAFGQAGKQSDPNDSGGDAGAAGPGSETKSDCGMAGATKKGPGCVDETFKSHMPSPAPTASFIGERQQICDDIRTGTANSSGPHLSFSLDLVLYLDGDLTDTYQALNSFLSSTVAPELAGCNDLTRRKLVQGEITNVLFDVTEDASMENEACVIPTDSSNATAQGQVTCHHVHIKAIIFFADGSNMQYSETELFNFIKGYCYDLGNLTGVTQSYDSCASLRVTSDEEDSTEGGGGGASNREDDDMAPTSTASSRSASSGVSAGGVSAIAAASLIVIVSLVLFARFKQKENRLLRHHDMENYDDRIYLKNDYDGAETIASTAEYSESRQLRAHGEGDTVFSGWSNYSASRMEEGPSLRSFTEPSGSLYQHTENEYDHVCSSPTCEACESKRAAGVQFVPRMPGHGGRLPPGATREYREHSTVQL